MFSRPKANHVAARRVGPLAVAVAITVSLGASATADAARAQRSQPILFLTVHQLEPVPYDVDERLTSANPDGSGWKRVYDDHSSFVNGASRSPTERRIAVGDFSRLPPAARSRS
jgi:hypothetical protein